MNERKERCETCRFWESYKEQDEEFEIMFGNCHRFPPQFRDSDVLFCGPVVARCYWCGEWQAVETTKRLEA